MQEKHIFFSLILTKAELLALTEEDFSLNGSLMSINKSYYRMHKKDMVTPPKTFKSERVIALPEFLGEAVCRYLQQRKPGSAERIFSYSKYFIAKFMREACVVTGVKSIRIHDLRHSHASLLIEMGCSPLLIAERLGHENIETTLNTYSHLYPNKQKKLAEDLHDLYCVKSPDHVK